MEKENSRRNFLKKSAAFALGTLAATSVNKALAATGFIEKEIPAEGGKFSLPALPYGYDALEPHIDKMTMEIHHDKHHKGYVDNLNKALDGNAALSALSIDQLVMQVNKETPMAIRNNGGGHYNHSLFWTLMKPNAGKPSGKLADAITKTFGSVDEFKKQFGDAAAKRFGSGWAWLVKTADGKLVITSTANQDNPLMQLETVEVKGTPVLALDVWEHAYYLKNQNRRADYIASWWNVLNWEKAEELYNAR